MKEVDNKKKIGIVTFHYSKNFGAMLQAYALKRTLEKNGFLSEFINYACRSDELNYKMPLKFSIKNIKNPKRAILSFFENYYEKENHDSWNKFDLFMKENLEIKDKLSLFPWQLLNSKYDAIICGSDQIWNPDVTKGLRREYFADINKTIRRIAYAASVGELSSIYDYSENIKTEIQKMDFVSVREDDLQKYLKEKLNIEAELVLDPTLLLNENEYKKILVEPKIEKKTYIVTYNISGIPNHVSKTSKKISKLFNIYNVEISGKLSFPSEKNYKRIATGGPSEFLGWIKNSKYVVTDSFHGVAFSIIMHKNFYYIPNKRTRRVLSLLEMLGLTSRIVKEDLTNIDLNDINYSIIDKKLNQLRRKSIDFIIDSINGPFLEKHNCISYLQSKEKKDCYGCGLCSKICTSNAIKMIQDKNGFEYPVIDEKKCKKCNMCVLNCPLSNKNNYYPVEDKIPKSYIATNVSNEIKMCSSSGGMFSAFSDLVLDNGGLVAGAIYKENNEVIHSIASNSFERNKQRKSKYVQSKAYVVYKKIKEELDNNKIVLFSGTSCQIAALRRFLNKEYEKLYTIDLFCVGASSPLIYSEYLKFLEKKYGKIKAIDFRTKNKNTLKKKSKTCVSIELESGSRIEDKMDFESYYRIQDSFVGLRPACYRCEYSSPLKPSDLTIGDCRLESEAKFDCTTGLSTVLVHTKKGYEMLNKAIEKNKIIVKEIDMSLIINAGVDYTKYIKVSREKFWDDFEKKGYAYLAKKYGGCDKKSLLKKKIKNIIRK